MDDKKNRGAGKKVPEDAENQEAVEVSATHNQQEVDKPIRVLQEIRTQTSHPDRRALRASKEIPRSPTKSKEITKPRKKSNGRVTRDPDFPDLEDEPEPVIFRKKAPKPRKNIFRAVAEKVSSIFFGPKDSDSDSFGSSRQTVEPIPLNEAGPDMSRFFGPNIPVLDAKARRALEVKSADAGINKELSLIMEHYKETTGRQDKKSAKDRSPKYKYGEIMTMLKTQGIPIPTDEDFARLESSQGQKWDPDGTVLEYYSPVLRSFIPVNMRGRYRGCWSEDQCVQGLDISKLAPKPDALEGYVDRGRQYRIQAIYDAMQEVTVSADHLDYLVELYKTQVTLLPIPIFYDVLNLGCETLNWNIKILQSKEGIPPQNKIYSTTEDRAVSMQKKLQVYAALGLEPLFTPRKGMGRIQPQWTKTRDELITSLIARQYELDHGRNKMQQAQNVSKKKVED